MDGSVDRKRILLFIALAFGIAWTAGLIVYLTGGLENSPSLIPGTDITVSLVFIALVYMWAPSIAHVLTRRITREGWGDTKLQFQFKRNWIYWFAAWILPAVLTIVGAVIYFQLFPLHYDVSLTRVMAFIPENIQGRVSPWVFIAVQIIQGIVIAPILNGVFTFGEEFGWRAYLQPQLMPLGGRRAVLWVGLIWGIWHWPMIAMGHNYGLEYPGAPWLGMFAMVWFTIVLGIFLGWLVLRSGSVWPAVIGHAAANGTAALGFLFVQGQPNLLLGPLPVGLIGSVGWTMFAIWILLKPGALVQTEVFPLQTTEKPVFYNRSQKKAKN